MARPVADGAGVFAEEEEDRPPTTLSRAIRGAFASYLDEIVLFVVTNVGWVFVGTLAALAFAVAPITLILAPLLALPTAVLTRLAVAAARRGTPRWEMVTAEIGRRAGRKLLLAAAQLLILAVGLANLSLTEAIGGLPGILSAVVAGYAVIASSVYALATWPIVCDPRRDGPLRDQLRLALAVVLTRPLQMGVLALITTLAVFVSYRLVVPAVFLPSLVLLAVADYVVDCADRLAPLPDG